MFTLNINLSPSDLSNPEVAAAIVNLSRHVKIDKRWVDHMWTVMSVPEQPPMYTPCGGYRGMPTVQPPFRSSCPIDDDDCCPRFTSSSCPVGGNCHVPSPPCPEKKTVDRLESFIEAARLYKKNGMFETLIPIAKNMFGKRLGSNVVLLDMLPEIVDVILCAYDGKGYSEVVAKILQKYMMSAASFGQDCEGCQAPNPDVKKHKIPKEIFKFRLDKILETAGEKSGSEEKASVPETQTSEAQTSGAASSVPVEDIASEAITDDDVPKTLPKSFKDETEAVNALFSGFGFNMKPYTTTSERTSPTYSE